MEENENKELYDKDLVEYLGIYHSIVNTGLLFGLKHPIEWWINYINVMDNLRYQVGIPTQDPNIAYKHSKRYFEEMYEVFNINPPSEENVKTWLSSFYPEGHLFKKSFEELMLKAYDYKKE